MGLSASPTRIRSAPETMRKKASRPRHARMLGAATRGTKKEPTGLFFATCGRPCSFDSSYGLHETATTLDIPSCWDPRANQSPTGALVAVLCTAALFDSRTGQIKNASSECNGSYHGRHSYRIGTRTLKKSPLGSFLPPAGGRVPSIPRTGCMKKSLILRSGILFMTRTGIEPMLQP